MISKFVAPLLRVGVCQPSARLVTSRAPIVLLYHGVPARNGVDAFDGHVFDEHIRFLKRHFELVGPDELLRRRRPQDRCEVLLTLDDGFRNNAEVAAPILRRYSVPAVFFVCSRPAMAGKYLWFSYLWALERHFDRTGFHFRTEFYSMSPDNRRQSVQRLWSTLLALTPHPSAMYTAIEDELPRLEDFISPEDLANCYAGMSAEQIGELAADPLFSVGIHTVDHPLLTKCEPAEALRQIQDNRAWLEETCGHTCDVIAYPGGDYNRDVLGLCGMAGLSRGYCVSRSVNMTPQMEIPRLGIYSTSTDILGLKAQWGSLMRSMRLPVG